MESSLLRIIPYISGTLSLIAFVVWAVATSYRKALDRNKEMIEAAPPGKRLEQTKVVLDGLDINMKNLNAEQVFILAQKVLDNRAKRFRLVAIVSVVLAMILALSSILAYSLTRKPLPSPRTEAHEAVTSLQDQIGVEAGNYELMLKYEGPTRDHAALDVYNRASNLGHQLLNIADEKLSVTYQVQKYQHASHALYMAATAAADQLDKQKLSEEAIFCAKNALQRLEYLKEQASTGDKQAIERHQWMQNDHALERVTFYLAVAVAINARAGGESKIEQAIDLYNSIPGTYRTLYPPSNPDLIWVLSQNH
jgi:hypothetical protein